MGSLFIHDIESIASLLPTIFEQLVHVSPEQTNSVIADDVLQGILTKAQIIADPKLIADNQPLCQNQNTQQYCQYFMGWVYQQYPQFFSGHQRERMTTIEAYFMAALEGKAPVMAAAYALIRFYREQNRLEEALVLLDRYAAHEPALKTTFADLYNSDKNLAETA